MNNNSFGLIGSRVSNFQLSTAWSKRGQLWRQTVAFPPPVPQLTLKSISGSSGGGGGNNPLNFNPAVNYTPAIGDLLFFVATYSASVNQLFQPGDTIPAQPIGLNISDGINAYTPVAYQEVFPPYLGAQASAVASGMWASIATNTTLIPSVFVTTNTLHDSAASTGYVSQANFSCFFYALSPGRMPVKMYNFFALAVSIALPKFPVNTGRFCILGSSHAGGTLTTNMNFRNDFLFETNPFVGKTFVRPTASANANATPFWCGSVVRI